MFLLCGTLCIGVGTGGGEHRGHVNGEGGKYMACHTQVYTSKSTQGERGNLASHNVRKPFGSQGSAPYPTGGAYSAP